MHQLRNILESMRRKGLYGLFSNPGFGNAALLTYFASCFSAVGDKCLFVSLEIPKELLLKRMHQSKMNTDCIKIIESMPLNLNFDEIAETIISESPKAVFVDRLRLIGPDTVLSIKSLKSLSEQLSIPIVFNCQLPRCSGDYDPFERRPELYDLTFLFPLQKTIDEIHNVIRLIDIIMFLHRNHDCERGIGTAHRYNISNSAELILKSGKQDSSMTVRFDIRDILIVTNKQENRIP